MYGMRWRGGGSVAEDDGLRATYAAECMTATEGHPSEEAWERLALRELRDTEREAFFDHVTRCASCAGVYRGLKQLETEARAFDSGVPAATPVAHGRLRQAWYAGLTLAAIVLIAFLVPRGRNAALPEDPLRSAPAVAPVPVEPLGPLTSPPARFRWEGVAGADKYRVDAFSADGRIEWSSPEVVGTAVPWPSALPATPGTVYYWKVTAIPGLDRRIPAISESPLVSFEIATAP
jgi:hypothetical protein